MLEDPRSFFEDLAPQSLDRIRRVLPDKVVVAFYIDGPGGGSWQVEQRGPRIGPVGDGPKDCEVRCSEEDFMDILRGIRSPQKAFSEGRLTVTGDVGLVLKLRRLFISAA